MSEEFERVYEESRNAVLRYIASHCLNISDIEDIYQDTYLRAYEALSGRTDIEDAPAFIMGIAKNAVARHYTVLSRIASKLASVMPIGSAEAVSDDTDIEALTEDRMLYEEVTSELCTCPAEVQRIFYLHYLLGLTLDETAECLSLKPGRVRQQLYKTLRRLRRKYKGRDKNEGK